MKCDLFIKTCGVAESIVEYAQQIQADLIMMPTRLPQRLRGYCRYGEFRSHLVLGCFLTMDHRTSILLHREMAPFEIRLSQLQQTTGQAAAWLRDLMGV